jgi:hypothetical protein
MIMGNFVIALIAAIIIALGAYVVLDKYQKPVDEAFATTGVRI